MLSHLSIPTSFLFNGDYPILLRCLPLCQKVSVHPRCERIRRRGDRQPTEPPTCDRPGDACFPWTHRACTPSLPSVPLTPVKWSHSHPVCQLNDTLLLPLSAPHLSCGIRGRAPVYLPTPGTSGAPGLDGSQVSATSPSYAKASCKKFL